MYLVKLQRRHTSWTPKGCFFEGNFLFQGNLAWRNVIIWPDMYIYVYIYIYAYFSTFLRLLLSTQCLHVQLHCMIRWEKNHAAEEIWLNFYILLHVSSCSGFKYHLFLLCCLVSLPACHLQIISGIWGPPQWNFRISHPEVFEETLYFDAAMRSAAAGYMAAFGLTMQSLFTYSN